MIGITALDLTEDPIRYIAERTRETPLSHLVVFPTVRNIRHYYGIVAKHFGKRAVVSPCCYEMSEFLRECLDTQGTSLVSKHLRPFYLQRAIRSVKRERLDNLFKGGAAEMQHDFIRFASTGARILRFFDEIFAEKITPHMLRQASLYTDYEKHIGVLDEIAGAYREVLSDDGFIDPMFLKYEGKAGGDRFKRFEKVHVLVSGYLARFEIDLLRAMGKEQSVEVIIRYEGEPDRQTKKIFDTFDIEPVRRKTAGLPSSIEIRAYDEASGQFGFAVHAVERALRSGIAPEDIAVILPDDNMKRTFFGLDRKRVFNYAMGLNLKDTIWYSLLDSIESLFRERVDRIRYRSESIIKLLKHPLIQNLSSGEDWIDAFIASIRYKNSLILKEDDFCTTDPFKDIFMKIRDLATSERGYNDFLRAVSRLVGHIIQRVDEDFMKSLKQNPEFAESGTSLITYLYQSISLPYGRAYRGTDPMMHLHYLMGQLADVTYDDVAGGLITVMGMLETRNMNFRAVIIPDMNEEMMPPRSEKEMFLNTNVRQTLEIPDYQDRENLSRSYFSSLIKNAEMVFLSYVERDERPIRSRFIEEILIETGHTGQDSPWFRDRRQYDDLLFYTKPVNKETSLPDSITKDEEALALVQGMTLTPYKLRTYRQCSYKFFLQYVKELDEPVEISGALAPVDIGNILHRALKNVYQEGKMHDNVRELYEEICSAVKEESRHYDMFQLSPHAQFELDVMIDKLYRFVESELRRHKEGWQPLYIEKKLNMTIANMHLTGRIDRVDIHEGNGNGFIIDYKYSKVSRLRNIRYDERFCEFQLPLYRMMLGDAYPELHIEGFGYYDLRDSFRLMTVQERGSADDFAALLRDVVEEIRSVERDFFKTDDISTCMYCGFTRICGRQKS